MTRRNAFLGIEVLFALAMSAAAASAGDAVRSAIAIPAGQPVPIIAENGTPYAQGTYAIGTIQLLYTVHAYQFPTGPFAAFRLCMSIDANGQPGQTTAYPVNYLTLGQTGSANVGLSPEVSQFSITGVSWWACPAVTISIPAGVSSDDGTTLVGNLQLDAPGSAHLKTTTSVQVKITLVHPDACLKLYNFLTDESFTDLISSTDVNVNAKKGTITSTTPYGQISDDVLVVNTCSVPQTFDLKIWLNPYFSTNPSGNPGNAVFTYFASGSVDPSTFNISSFGNGTKQGQALQFAGITVPAGQMFLTTVHMSVNRGQSAAGLGTTGTLSFAAQLFQAGTGFGTTMPGVTPSNPAWAILGYTVK